MAMLLKGLNGNEFELAFTRDSLPDSQDGFGDSRWATVTFRAATADDSWEEQSPAINLFEFAHLAEWLEAAGAQAPDPEREGRGDQGDIDEGEVSELELLEPELRFSLTRQDERTVTLRIGFHLQGRPEEFEVDADTDEAEYIDLRLPRESLLSAARTLRDALQAVERGSGKDDVRGTRDPGAMGESDEALTLIDRIHSQPPGAGTGEDNAGNR
jgi:hypothetical protein